MTNHTTELAKAVRQAARTAANAAELSYKNANPAAHGLKFKLDVAAFKPRPRAMAGYETKIIAWFIQSSEYRKMTNKMLAEKLGKEIGGYAPPSNLLTAPLKPWQINNISDLLIERDIVLNLSGLTTLSKFKAVLKAYFDAGLASDQFEGTISVTSSHVTVGSRSFPISSEGKYDRIDVKGSKINVASLRRLLEII